MKKLWGDQAWEDYLYWQSQDKKVLRRLNLIIKDIERGGYEGIGRPEPLKDNLEGLWSRRIDEVNRIVYRVEGDSIEILQCRGHYHN